MSAITRPYGCSSPSTLAKCPSAVLRVAIIVCAIVCSLTAPQAVQALPEPPGHGFKRCEVIYRPVRFTIYARHLRCGKAIRIIHEYGGPGSYERGFNELCLKNYLGWCCGGGGGSVRCSRGKSIVVEASLTSAASQSTVRASRAVDTASGQALVRCETHSGATVPRARPRTCDFVKAGAPSPPFGYQEFIVTNLRWRHWGAPTTIATGMFEGNMDARAPVTVSLSDLRECPDTRVHTYRLLKVRFQTPEYNGTSTSMAITGCGRD